MTHEALELTTDHGDFEIISDYERFFFFFFFFQAFNT